MDYPNGTKEMIQFAAALNAANAENSTKRARIVERLTRKRDQIADALIGIGTSLKSLTEQKDAIEAELKAAEAEFAYKDPNSAFLRKFGVPMYGLNLSPKLSQEEVDAIVSDPADDE